MPTTALLLVWAKVAFSFPSCTRGRPELSLHPNPVEAELLVDGLKVNTDYQVTVRDLLGMTVVPATTIHTNLLGEFPMTVGELPAGVYFIHVDDGSGPVMAKFMKR